MEAVVDPQGTFRAVLRRGSVTAFGPQTSSTASPALFAVDPQAPINSLSPVLRRRDTESHSQSLPRSTGERYREGASADLTEGNRRTILSTDPSGQPEGPVRDRRMSGNVRKCQVGSHPTPSVFSVSSVVNPLAYPAVITPSHTCQKVSGNVRSGATPLPEGGFRPRTPATCLVTPALRAYCQTASRTPMMAYEITG